MAVSTEMIKAIGDDDAFDMIIQRRRKERMAKIDNFPKPIRECVHLYGYTVVDMLLSLGIRKPRHIRHIVETILDEFSPTRGSGSSQGIRAAKGMKE